MGESSERRAIDVVVAFRPPLSREDLAERLNRWGWPSVEMAVAAGLSWLASTWVFGDAIGDAIGYAPITAIVAMGLGRERRIGRSIVLVCGLVVGIAVAEIATLLVGIGWWQVGLILGISALVAGVIFDVQLAVTYATINAVVLFGTPGGDGWIPDRAIDGLIGVVVAFVVTYVLVPPRPDTEIVVRMRKVADVAVIALDEAALLLADQDADDREIALDAAHRIDAELGRLPGTVDHGLDVVRFAPLRWRGRDRVERLATAALDLRSVVTTVSTIVRLTDRAIVDEVRADPSLADAVETAGTVLDALVTAVTDDVDDDAAFGSAHDAIDRFIEDPSDKGVSIALREEVHGLLHDLARFAERHGGFELDGDDRLSDVGDSTVRYGRSAGEPTGDDRPADSMRRQEYGRHMTWPAPSSTALVRISTSSGAVHVVAEPGRSEIWSNREPIEVRPATIDAGSNRVECRVPEGADLVVGSSSGRVRVEGRVGSVSVLTTSGRISIEHAASVDARSKTGRITIDRADGECRVVNGSGRVEIGRCGAADVTSTNGRLTIGEATGEVRARGTSGRIEVTLAGAHDVDAETVSGRIEVRLPAAVRAQVVDSAAAADPEAGDCVIVARSTSGRVVVTNG